MLRRIREIVKKELIQVFRDRRMRAIVFVVPVIQLVVFGYAVTTDVRSIATAVYDADRSPLSRELVRRMEGSGYFRVREETARMGDAERLLERGEVLCVVRFPVGFGTDLKRGRGTSVQVLVDGTESQTATVAMQYATRIIAAYSAEFAPPSARPPLDLRPRAWYNPELESRNYNVPGVIAILTMLVCLLLTSLAIVREREAGTMEQLMVTPLTPLELILGKTIPFALVGFFEMGIVTVAGLLIFRVPLHGSILLLAVATGIYLLSVLGFGLLLSTMAGTQQQALMGSFLFFAPAILLSGFIFPIDNMPLAVQYATYLNPLRYFLVVIRGIFLKGNGIDVLWPQLVALLLLGVGVIAFSSLRFRRRLG